MRLIPGIVALFGCIGLAFLNVGGYVRHLDSGDQAGFSMGTFFLVGWFLPIAAALLLTGAILVAPVGPRRWERPLHIIAVRITLIAGAVFFAAYARWMTVTFGHARQTGSGALPGGSFVATILAFSVTAFVCALSVRLDSSAPRRGLGRWLSGAMLILAAVVSYQIAAQVAGFMSEGMLPIYLPFVTGPTVAWVGMLVWSAWRLGRGRAPQPS